VMNKHVEVLQQHSNEEPITDFLVCTEWKQNFSRCPKPTLPIYHRIHKNCLH
jgi:hypothetical protein